MRMNIHKEKLKIKIISYNLPLHTKNMMKKFVKLSSWKIIKNKYYFMESGKLIIMSKITKL